MVIQVETEAVTVVLFRYL